MQKVKVKVTAKIALSSCYCVVVSHVTYSGATAGNGSSIVTLTYTLYTCICHTHFKGTVAQDFFFLPTWIGLNQKINIYWFLFFLLLLLLSVLITKTLIGDSWNSPRWVNKCGQQFLENSYFLLGELLARCTFFSDINSQIVHIIGETLTNLADFCPFVIFSSVRYYNLQNYIRQKLVFTFMQLSRT